MSQKDEYKPYKPLFEDFLNVKSIVSSPDLSKRKNLESNNNNSFQEKIEKPFLSDQAKLLLEELHKYRTVYKPSEKDNTLKEEHRQINSISNNAKKILEEFKFDSKNFHYNEGTNESSKKGIGSEINTNLYSLTEPFTFEARDFDISKESPQIRSNLEQSLEIVGENIEEKQKKPANTQSNLLESPVKTVKEEKKIFVPIKKEVFSPKKPSPKMKNSKVLEFDLKNNRLKVNNEAEFINQAKKVNVNLIDSLKEQRINAKTNNELYSENMINLNKTAEKTIDFDNKNSNNIRKTPPKEKNKEKLFIKENLFELQTKIHSYSHLDKPDFQRYCSEPSKSVESLLSSSNKEHKMKGFQVQIDNIINNCFSNFIHRSFPTSSPTKQTHKSESYSHGFFSYEEKTRTMPVFDNIGKEMEGILKKIKSEIAKKTEIYAMNLQGDNDMRKSRFITEIQQAVKASLEELEPNQRNSFGRVPNIEEKNNNYKSSQMNNYNGNQMDYRNNEMNSNNKINSNNNQINSNEQINNNTHYNNKSSVDKEVLEEIVKKTTNEMVLSLMKSNLLENPHSQAKKHNPDLSRSVEDMHSFKEASVLTTNFHRKKLEILNQIEYIDKEILLMETHEETLDNSLEKPIEEHTKNSFLSNLTDTYFRPRIKPKKTELLQKAQVKNPIKTQSVSDQNPIKIKAPAIRYTSPATSQPKTLKKMSFVPKVITSCSNKKALYPANFHTASLKSFEERNRQWQESRELKIQKSKEKLDGMYKECTFQPQIIDKHRLFFSKERPITLKERYLASKETSKERNIPSKDRTLTSINSPKKIIITPVKKNPFNALKAIVKNNSVVKSKALPEKSTTLLKNIEKRKLFPQTEKKAEITKKPLQQPFSLKKEPKKALNPQPAVSRFKSILASKTMNPSVFKQKAKQIYTNTKAKTLNKTSEKSPAKSNNSNKNETSMEDMFKNKLSKNKDKGEMKELIGVLRNLTKTIKEKNEPLERGSENTVDPFEFNIKMVYPNELERDKTLNGLKIEGFEEQIATEKALTEKVNQELREDDEDEEDFKRLGKSWSLEKYSGLINKANILTDQIRKAFMSTEKL